MPLLVRTSGAPGAEHRLEGKAEYRIGRAPDNDVVLTSDRLASQYHARIRATPEGLLLLDDGSRNGVRVGGRRVERHLLRDGDFVQLGVTSFRFVDPATAPRRTPVSPAKEGRASPVREIAAFLGVALLAGAVVAGAGLSVRYLRKGEPGRGKRPAAPAVPVSRAAALDVRPIPEVRLTAPAGALDRDRTFQVTRLGPEELDAISPGARAAGVEPIAAFRVDGQMRPEERFPGELTVRLDLAKLGVPKERWPGLAAAHVHPAGAPDRLLVALEGGDAVVTVRHNDAIVLGTILTLLTGYLLESNRSAKDGTVEMMGDQTDHFVYHWPAGKPSPDAAARREFDSATAELARCLNELHGLQAVRVGRGEGSDPERVAELRRRAGELEQSFQARFPLAVRRQKIWPASVDRFATALENAHVYLVGHRRFRKPGYLIDVYLRDPWPHGSAAALTQKLATVTPYIDISEEKDPDAVALTSVHELFHVVEKEYRWYDSASHGWFDEAAARVLEADAQGYYTSRRLASRWQMTERSFVAFQRGLDDPPAGNAEAVQHGYSASRFFEWLQGRYFQNDRDAFLFRLYEDFSGMGGGRVESLVRVTSNDAGKFDEDYRAFVSANAPGILEHGLVPQERQVSLGEARPLHDWNRRPFAPISASSLVLRIVGVPPQRQAGTFVVVQDVPDATGGELAWSPDSVRRTVQKHAEGRADPRWQGGQGWLDVQRVEPATEPPGLAVEPATRVYVMIPPAKGPRGSVEGKSLVVRIERSRLAELGVVTGYHILLRPPAGPELTIKTDREETAISLDALRDLRSAGDGAASAMIRQQMASFAAALRGKVTNQDLRDFWDIREYDAYRKSKGSAGPNPPWGVKYREVTGKKVEILGPESPSTPVDVSPTDLDPGLFDPGGSWVGRILLTDLKVDMTARYDGSGISGTSGVRGGSPGGFVGRWDPAEEGWQVESVRGKNDTPVEQLPAPLQPVVRALQHVTLRRFPGERLWLVFPPALFHRAELDAPPRPPEQRPVDRR